MTINKTGRITMEKATITYRACLQSVANTYNRTRTSAIENIKGQKVWIVHAWLVKDAWEWFICHSRYQFWLYFTVC